MSRVSGYEKCTAPEGKYCVAVISVNYIQWRDFQVFNTLEEARAKEENINNTKAYPGDRTAYVFDDQSNVVPSLGTDP